MNILFLTYDFPYPTTSGGKARAYNLLKYASRGATIHLFSFVREKVHEDSLQAMKSIGVKTITTRKRRNIRDIRNISAFISPYSFFHTLYYDNSVAALLKEIVLREKITILHCESFYTAYYLNGFADNPSVKKIYGSENIEYRLYEEFTKHSAPALLRPLYAEQTKRIKREEEHITRNSDVTLAVTETEKMFFQQFTKNVAVIENGVSLREFQYKPRKKQKTKTILFVGNFHYFPNNDAVTFFYEEVFKNLKRNDVRFEIIGKGANRFTLWKDNSVRTVEFIPDIRDAYYNADIFISPIRIGGGTNFKILEAMATGLPVISFSDRVRDIGAKNAKDVLLADDAGTFLRQTELLLDDANLAVKLAENARKIIEQKFSWDGIGDRLHGVWSNV